MVTSQHSVSLLQREDGACVGTLIPQARSGNTQILEVSCDEQRRLFFVLVRPVLFPLPNSSQIHSTVLAPACVWYLERSNMCAHLALCVKLTHRVP